MSIARLRAAFSSASAIGSAEDEPDERDEQLARPRLVEPAASSALAGISTIARLALAAADLKRHFGHCHVPVRHSISAPQRRQSSLASTVMPQRLRTATRRNCTPSRAVHPLIQRSAGANSGVRRRRVRPPGARVSVGADSGVRPRGSVVRRSGQRGQTPELGCPSERTCGVRRRRVRPRGSSCPSERTAGSDPGARVSVEANSGVRPRGSVRRSEQRGQTRRVRPRGSVVRRSEQRGQTPLSDGEVSRRSTRRRSRGRRRGSRCPRRARRA